MSEGEEELNVGAVRLEEVASRLMYRCPLRPRPCVESLTSARKPVFEWLMLRGGWVIAPQKLWHRWQG